MAATLGLVPGLAIAQQSGGIEPEWDVRKTLSELTAGIARMKPLLDKVAPERWGEEGAPPGYVDQVKSARAQFDYVASSSEKLARRPESVAAALDTYFRMQNLELILGSVIEGVRKYQSPDLAGFLRAEMTASNNNREKLRQYVMDLAETREQEFQVMDSEAQRCRQMLARPSPPAPRNPSPARKTERK